MSSRGVPGNHGDHRNHRRRRNALVVIVIAVLAVALWIFAIVALSSGDNAANEASAPETTEQAPVDSGATTVTSATSEPDETQDTDETEDTTSGGDAGSEQAATPSTSSGEGREDPESANEESQQEPKGDADVPLPDSVNSSGHEGHGGGKEHKGFDPLGKNPEPGDLTQTQEERVKSAADRFITAAYGYTGDSEKEYTEGVTKTALALGLYPSPGGERIQEYAEEAGEEGIASAAAMDRFEITKTKPNQVEGVAHFRVGSEYDRFSQIEGETTEFKQKLKLCPAYSSYRVCWAGREEAE